MKNNIMKRAVSLLLALVCVLGVLPLSAFAAGLSSAPASITQRSSDYMKIGGRSVRYKAASSVINNVGLPYVFDEQVTVPGLDAPVRALCAYQKGTLGPAANGQKWNFQETVNCASLKVLLTYVYSHTYGDFTEAGDAIGLEHWNNYWSDIWFMVAQAMSWYYEHGIIKDVNSDREGFIEQAAEEFVAAMKLYHETYGQSSFIKDWSKIGTHSIIDSADGGVTGNSAYDYIAAGVNSVMDHPENYLNYHLWTYEWDKSQPWKLAGQSGVPMQRLLIAVPDPEEPTIDTVRLTVKKLEAGTNKPMAGVTFKIENANDPAAFSVTRETGADGTITLTKEADDLSAGQYQITEEAVPEGYVAQTASQLVTVLPGSSANSVFTFYNEPDIPNGGDGSIRKVDADNPTVGIPGAIIRITSVKLDDGGNFTSEYTTGDGGYIPKSDLDFGKLPKGSYIAEEITPPEGYILSSDVSKVKQPFVWDGEHDISLIFENSSKVRVQLKKVDESNAPLPGAIFVILRDGQVIGTEETQADGTITVSNVTEGYYQFREVSAPAGFDCDRSPVGVHVEAEDLQGEQTIVVTKMNHHKRSLTIQKRDAESGDPIPGTSFHIRGVNLGYENDVVTGADGKAVLESMPSGCYEITETDVPKPYILDSNNRKTVWIDAEKDKDVVVDFVNSKLPGVRLVKRDAQTNQPIPGATFKIEEVDGGFTDQRQTDKDGVIFWENLRPGAYKVYEVTPAPNYVHDDTVHVVQLEPNHTTTIELTNIIKPTLKVLKVDSVTHSPIANVKFQIWRGSDDTITGELNDLGTFQTNASGEIVLEHIDTGWYRIKELEPAPGFTIKQPDTQDIYLKAGEAHEVQFENVPKNCIIVEKYDSVTGEALPGCTFQLRYLAGTSGTGGTVIGQKVTGKNGIAMWTGLEPGAYVIEEVDPADGYSIINSSETVYLADNGEQSVITVRFDNMPDGILLVRKVCATNPSITLQNAEFKITYADGGAVGPDDGIYFTDKSGDITLTGLEPGMTVIAREVKTLDGFVLDGTPQDIQIKGGVQQLTFWNKRAGTLVIEKKDSVSGAFISGAQFQLTYANGGFVDNNNGHLSSNGLYTTDDKGQIRIEGITGTVVAKETKPAPGYVIDQSTQVQTVTVNPMDTQTLTFLNEPLCSLTITKLDAVTGKPVPNTQFVIKDGNGAVLARCTTGQDGTATVTGLIPGSTVQVVETKVPDGYVLNTTPQVITVKNGANTLTGSSGGTVTTPGGNSGTNVGGSNDVVVENDRKMTLTIKKYITGTNREPLAGVCFKLTDGFGTPIGAGDGTFYTNSAGEIVIPDLEPGTTVTAQEVATVEGFVLNGEPKSITIKSGKQAPELVFWNERAGTLVIRKLDSVTKKPLAGVQFELTHPDGRYVDAYNGHLSSKGIFQTDQNGEIRVSVTGTVVVKETKTLPGYSIDPAGQIQTVEVNPDDTQYLTFYNSPAGNFELIKVVAGNKEKRIPNVTFEIRRADDDALIDTVTTDSEGRATLQLEAGNYYAVETECPKEYRLDSTRRTFTMKDGKNTTLTVENKAFSGILIHKTDSVTGKGIYGVSFLLYDNTNKPIGQYTSDNNGYVYIEGLTDGGRYYLRELENEGYIPDTQMKTVYVTAGETTLIEWKNTPITAQIQITKKSADYNSTNGLPAGTLLEGAVFEIYDKAGNVVDTIRSDSRGVATSKPLPLGRYTIREVKAPANYGVIDQELTAYLEHEGQIVRFEVTNKSLTTGVSITKTGPNQIIAGQPVNYTFSSIANNSNVMLTSFYWRDTLPAEVRLDTVVTGTYNFPGRYKITYRVNGGEPRTLADNLSTQKNYTLAASSAALGLASNERVTEVMFVFGQAPAGFAQVEKPMLKCTAVRNMASSAFTNIADVGGVYNGVWVQAISRWVTTVYGKPIVPTLPKTGY